MKYQTQNIGEEIILEKYYKHRDFYLGAYLIVNGCSLISHSRENGFTTFIFKDENKLHELVENFYSLHGTVDALTYSSTIRSLKSVIHSSSKSMSKGQNQNGIFNNNEKGRI